MCLEQCPENVVEFVYQKLLSLVKVVTPYLQRKAIDKKATISTLLNPVQLAIDYTNCSSMDILEMIREEIQIVRIVR